MPEYTALALLAVAAVLSYELAWARTGVLRSPATWCTLAICLAFQCLVDGYLTRLGRPIVRYAPGAITGWRAPFDIPVEDFLFGFALLTFVLVRWERLRVEPAPHRPDPAREAA
jgi:lycopene cyclase domain-containing protein